MRNPEVNSSQISSSSILFFCVSLDFRVRALMSVDRKERMVVAVVVVSCS